MKDCCPAAYIYIFTKNIYIYIYTSNNTCIHLLYSSVSLGCRINKLDLCISADEKDPLHPMGVLDMTLNSTGSEDLVLEFGGMWSTPSLSLIPSLL